MSGDFAQKRQSLGSFEDDSESRSGVLGLLNRFARKKDGVPSSSGGTSASGMISPTSSSHQTVSGHVKSNSSGGKSPHSARDDSSGSQPKRVPSLALPGASASLSDLPEYTHSPGRPQPKKSDADKSQLAQLTVMRKYFLGKPESQTTDDFALFKQFREMEPEFSHDVQFTNPFPFLKISVPVEDEEPEEQTRDAPPDLAASSAIVQELQPPKEDAHDVTYEQWCQQMMNLVQLHKQELNSSKYNEASTPRSARASNPHAIN